MSEIKPKKDFFMFTLLQPLIVREGHPLSGVVKEIYRMNSYPYIIEERRNSEIMRLSQENAPDGFRVKAVIFCLMYNKEFKA